MAVDVGTVIGGIATVCTTPSSVPQLKKYWETGSAGGLSLRMLILHSTGVALWIGYGVVLCDRVIIISNSISLLLPSGILFFKPAPPQHGAAAKASERTEQEALGHEPTTGRVHRSIRKPFQVHCSSFGQGGRPGHPSRRNVLLRVDRHHQWHSELEAYDFAVIARPVIDELYRTTPQGQRPDANDLSARLYDALHAVGADVAIKHRAAEQFT
jgi:MtN3 and saliva related transmembrane protein